LCIIKIDFANNYLCKCAKILLFTLDFYKNISGICNFHKLANVACESLSTYMLTLSKQVGDGDVIEIWEVENKQIY
jgi:hypothetical protein